MKIARRISFLFTVILCLSTLAEVSNAAGRGGAKGGGKGGGGPGGAGGTGGGRGGQGSGQGQTPSATQEPKFKDVAVNSSFYFIADDAKTYRWIKISATTASNTVNKAVAPVADDTVIKR